MKHVVWLTVGTKLALDQMKILQGSRGEMLLQHPGQMTGGIKEDFSEEVGSELVAF